MNEVKESLWRSLRGSVFAAICLFIIDAFLLGTVAIAFLAVAVLVVWMIPKALFAWKRKDVLRIRALKTTVYAIMVVAIIAAYVCNDRVARTRADKIVAAVNQYKADRKHYPSSLNELVPHYLGHVPRAKYVIQYGAFHYRRNKDGQGVLMYYGFPPFERRVYRFAHQGWITID